MLQPQATTGDASFAAALRASRATRRRRVPAWLLSAALHGVLFIAAALLIHNELPEETAEPDRAGGIVLVRPTASETRYFDESDAQDTASGEISASSQSALAESLPNPDQLPIDLSGVLPARTDLTGTGDKLTDVLPGVGELTTGVGRNKGMGGQTQTSVFGAQGVGSKFVYVFDRSGSMEGFGGRPLAAAKRELIKSLERIGSVNQFQIIFYNDKPSVLNPNPSRRPRLMFGTDAEKKLAGNFVRGIVASGYTRHMSALRMALGMAPDVIFFLTDADDPQLTDDDLAEVRRLNRAGATIHAIEFGSTVSPKPGNFLMRLASENGGTHVYVDVTRLPDDK